VVRDRGIGIAQPDLARVFEPYFTTKRTGSGLGLAIARNVVEGLGGAIQVSSQPGAGTEILIELPVDQAEGGPSPNHGEPARSDGGKRDAMAEGADR
jgi:signal transduction histidine kinase